jgi:Tfp pilus assembly protein PilZ
LATVAQLLDIRNHWSDKFVIDGKVGWINAIKYNIEKATGIGEAELEFYSL